MTVKNCGKIMRFSTCMKNRYVLSIFALLLVACSSLDKNISIITQRDCQAEYQLLLKRINENKKFIVAIQADKLFEFIDNFSPGYAVLYGDQQLSDWLKVLGIGKQEELDKSWENLCSFIGLNTGIFWKLRKNVVAKTNFEKMQIELWEGIFCQDKIKTSGRGSPEILDEISNLENKILKNNYFDIKVLLEQEKEFTKLFSLRNELAKIKGYTNYLDYKLKEEEIDEYNKMHMFMLQNMPEQIDAYRNIRGLVSSSLQKYSDLSIQIFSGMDLKVNGDKIKYFITKNWQYNKIFFTIIEPKGEGRIYICLSESKLYPDEFLNQLATLVHETGHALHFQHFAVEPLIFNFFDSAVTETVAIFFENIVYTKEWLKKYFPKQLSEEEINIIIKNRKISILETLQYSSFLWKFEKAIYENPEQDFNKLYNTIAKEVNLKKISQHRLWYYTSIFASHNLYYNNYTLGYLYAYKLHKLMEDKFGPYYFENPAAGKFLIENIFGYGCSLKKEELFKKIFGNDYLPIKEYLAYLQE
jgi:hypothetical protein